MATVFSERLAAIRKEKGVAQKMAAAELGVSQALLSHYEKGIRECSPAFIARAAAYYEVSADYLLGLSDEPRNMNTVFSQEEQPFDGDAVPQTMYRALVWLGREAESLSAACAAQVMRLYALSFYQAANVFFTQGKLPEAQIHLQEEQPFYLSIAEHIHTQQLSDALRQSSGSPGPCPRCVETILRSCEEQTKEAVNRLRCE